MKFFSSFLVLIYLFLAFVACVSDTTEELTETETIIPPPIQEEIIIPESYDTTYQNESSDFKITYNNDRVVSFEQMNKNANIRTLSIFFNGLYQKKISQKIKNGDSLSKGELMLLKYIIISQIYAIDSFSKSFWSDATKGSKSDAFSEILNYRANEKDFISEFRNCISRLSLSYVSSSDPVRDQIKRYAGFFSGINANVITKDLSFILKNHREVIDDTQFRGHLVGGFRPYSSSPLFENKELRPYKDMITLNNFRNEANNIGKCWDSLYPKGIIEYSNTLKDIDNDLIKYPSLASNTQARIAIEDLRMHFSNIITDHLRLFNIMFTDLPFSILTKYSYIQVQGAKGFYNDDEDKMKEIAVLYATSVRNADMVDYLNSSHASHLYVQFIQLLKSDLSSTEYESLKNASKLYQLDPAKIGNRSTNR